ncbi:MAG: GC-type dockerin domain-anchored protein [Planctomycetota bacterium]
MQGATQTTHESIGRAKLGGLTRVGLLASCGFALAATSASAQVFEWAAPVNGDWSDSSAWTPMGQPFGSDTAVFGFTTPYVVTVTESQRRVGTLNIANPEAQVHLSMNGSFFRLNDAFVGDGLFVVNADLSPAGTTVLVAGVISGTIELREGSELSTSLSSPGVFDPDSLVTGTGVINGPFVYQGRVLSKEGDLIDFRNGTNGGIVETQGTGLWDWPVAEMTNTRFVGITPISGFDTMFFGQGSTIDGSVLVNKFGENVGSQFRVARDAVVDGPVELNADPTNLASARFFGTDSGSGAVPTIGETGSVSGVGRIEGEWLNLGRVSPGLGDSVIGDLEAFVGIAATSIEYGPSSVVAIDIAGGDGTDTITGTATHTLGGAVVVNQITDDIRVFGERYEFLRGGSVTGEFDSLVADDLGDVLFFDLVYLDDTGVDLLVTCLADVDRSGTLDIDDFSAFVSSFFADADVADQDANGVLDIDDFSTFVANFFAGC